MLIIQNLLDELVIKMDKLISMVDFVKDNHGKQKDYFKHVCFEYAKFLSQELQLWMFVPCDEKCNVLEEPKIINDHHGGFFKMQTDFNQEKKYNEAKERVLFECFTFNRETDKSYWLRLDGWCSYFIEKDLSQDIECIIHKGFKLTPTALKQIGL